MEYKWSSDLETGFPDIDGQHKQLVTTLNELLSVKQLFIHRQESGLASAYGWHRAELKRILDFLVAYTVQHFASEEQWQLRHNYPDYERHKRLHEDFKVVALQLAERLLREGADISLVEEAYSLMGNWLVSHIKGEDLKIAVHAKE